VGGKCRIAKGRSEEIGDIIEATFDGDNPIVVMQRTSLKDVGQDVIDISEFLNGPIQVEIPLSNVPITETTEGDYELRFKNGALVTLTPPKKDQV
jgi:hypothetical protein